MQFVKLTVIGAFSLLSLGAVAQSKKQLKAELAKKEEIIKSYQKPTFPKQNLTSRVDSFSYCLGVDLYTNNLQKAGLDSIMKMDAFYLGLKNAEMGTDTFPEQLKDQLIRDVFAKRDAEMQKIEEAKQAEKNKEADANLFKGQQYMLENAKVAGVQSTPSGLQYRIIKSGDQKTATPKETSEVSVFYEGRLIDGTVFDGNFTQASPISFPLNGVIRGWTEIVQKMHVGDRWEVTIPAEMGYGANGGGPIGPNETLIFIIELVGIK
jgi:FKBP-type peptidyl-prolyl cis-trans isomerase FklB